MKRSSFIIHHSSLIFILLATLLATACEKELPQRQENLTEMRFNASLESLQFTDPNAKVYLHNEQWVYWELFDKISISSDKSSSGPSEGSLEYTITGTDFEDFNGVFLAPLPENSKYFLALYPHNVGNTITAHANSPNFDEPVINLYASQPRRADDKSDLTFARQVFPMVAWYGGDWANGDPPFNLDFHALAGIVRLELFNGTSEAIINSITFHVIEDAYSDNYQLCGPFRVKDFKTNFPYLVGTTGSDTCKTISLEFGPGGLSFPAGDIRTFYLVLPAMNGTGTTNYHLSMTVTTNQGNFTKSFKAPVRRNGLTNMRALGIIAWDASNSTTTAGLAGHGTQERPFKVYTADDFIYLRDCYNSTERTINGQPITSDTYITLMRSDIVLTSANWHSSAINNFIGHLSAASAAATPGITNNSNIPLFQSIGSGGYVTGITIKANADLSSTSATGVSPFCVTNSGEIKNCILRNATPMGVVNASYADIGGLVARNLSSGKIIGCAWMANLSVGSGSEAGGICLHNLGGEISGCYASSSLTVSASQAAGICYDNQGTVKDCYFAASIPSGSTKWGGIVYSNSTSNGIVEHCYYGATAQINSSGTVGGIAHTVSGGRVNYCWLDGHVRGSQVGGIAHTVSGGRLINCYANGIDAQIVVATDAGTNIGGGIAAIVSGGSVENSFAKTVSVISTDVGAFLGGFVGSFTGGYIANSYSYEGTHTFYGYTSLSGSALSAALSASTAPCYLVGYSQTGLTTKASTTSGLSSLLADLSGHIPDGGSSWQGTPPVLGAYIPY